MTDSLTYLIVKPGSAEEQAVRRIQDTYKAFFFVPFPQLEKAIRDGQVLAAVDGATVVGYAWYVVRHRVVKIRYVAVDRERSKRGVGRGIVNEILRRHGEAYSVRLSCRIDYPGWNFWKRLGFKPLRNRPGRAKAGSIVTDFCRELSPLPLFADQEEICDLALVAVDANVFFDLADATRPHHTESAGLLADWISAEIELCVTHAIHEDIGRSPDTARHANLLNDWRKVIAAPESLQCIRDRLENLIGAGTTPQDVSDRNHLSHVIAENVTTFITRDEPLLENGDRIYEEFGTRVQRPSDFIVNVDLVLSQERYDRHDFTSVKMSQRRVTADHQIVNLADFRRDRERERVLKGKLRSWIASPRDTELWTLNSAEKAEGIYVTTTNGVALEVPLIRCAHGTAGRRRGRTVARYLATKLRSLSGNSGVVRITDEYGIEEKSEIFAEAGFIQAGGAIYKFSLEGVWNPADAAREIARIGSDEGVPDEIVDRLVGQFDSMNDVASILNMEHAIWPGKLRSGGIVDCIVVPIQPRWARSLFDSNLGQAEFWEEDADLLMNPTSVYYSGSRIAIQRGRILWYVSTNDRYPGSKSVRASSQLTNRVIGDPIVLYRQFRHYGIYGLDDVRAKATDARPHVLALEFTDTESFPNPVPLDSARKVMSDAKQAFQWPTKVSEDVFFEIYQLGRGS